MCLLKRIQKTQYWKELHATILKCTSETGEPLKVMVFLQTPIKMPDHTDIHIKKPVCIDQYLEDKGLGFHSNCGNFFDSNEIIKNLYKDAH